MKLFIVIFFCVSVFFVQLLWLLVASKGHSAQATTKVNCKIQYFNNVLNYKDGRELFETFTYTYIHTYIHTYTHIRIYLVIVVFGLLFLSYSEETDDTVSKLWYWQDVLLEKASVEVQLDMEINPRIHVMPDHTLVLHNITPGDAGLYHCLKYRFLLDCELHFCQTVFSALQSIILT